LKTSIAKTKHKREDLLATVTASILKASKFFAVQPTSDTINQGTNTPPEPTPSLAERIFSHWLVSWILIPVSLIFFLHFFVFSAYHVVGSSMVPNLHDSDYLIISKVGKTAAGLTGQQYTGKRGEIVVFHYPKEPQFDFVKRVVGLPGERVVVKDGKITVYNNDNPNGLNPDEGIELAGSYTQAGPDDQPIDIVIPKGNIFVVGDNRTPNGSADSREWGLLPSNDIVGTVVLRLYPFNTIKLF